MAEGTRSRESLDQVGGRRQELCGPCKKRANSVSATVYCKECSQYQCAKCSHCHNIFEALSGHQLFMLNLETPLAQEVDMKGLDTCEQHQKRIEFFCSSHQALCCSSCAMAEHRGCHGVNEVSVAAVSSVLRSDAISSTLNDISATAQQVQSTADECTSPTVMAAQLESLLTQIDELKDSFVKRCDDLKTKVTEQCRQTQDMLCKETKENLTINQNILNKVEQYQGIVSVVFDHGSSNQKFIALQSIDKLIVPIKESLKTIRSQLCKLEMSVDVRQEVEDIVKSNDDFANFVIKKVSTDLSSPTDEKPIQPEWTSPVDLDRTWFVVIFVNLGLLVCGMFEMIASLL